MQVPDFNATKDNMTQAIMCSFQEDCVQQQRQLHSDLRDKHASFRKQAKELKLRIVEEARKKVGFMSSQSKELQHKHANSIHELHDRVSRRQTARRRMPAPHSAHCFTVRSG